MTRVLLTLLFLAAGPLAAAAAEPAAPAAPEPSIEQLLARGEAELESGEYRSARNTAQSVIGRDEKNAAAFVLRGRAETFLKDDDAALRSLNKAEQLGARVDAERGAVYAQREDWKKAAAAFAKGVTQSPDQADVHYLYGIALYRTAKYAEAVTSLAKAAELDPELEAEALVYTAAAALKQGDKPAAEKHLARAVEVAEPGSETARAAKEALEGLKSGGKSFEFGFGLAAQYDSNVLLVPEAEGLFSAAEVSNKAGSRLVTTLNGAWKPRFGQSGWRGLLGYGLYQSAHVTNRDTLKTFDVTNHALSLGAERKTETSALALPYSFSGSFLNTFDTNDRYSFTHALSPSYARRFGRHVVIVSDSIGLEDYENDPPALVTAAGDEIEQTRDNLFNNLNLAYQLLFADGRGNISPSLGVLYANATGDNSWDNTGIRLGLAATVPLGEAWRFDVGGALTGRFYEQPFVTEDAAGAPIEDDRSDNELAFNTGLGYARGAFNANLGLGYTNNDSTLDAFTYERVIYSLGFGLQY